MSKVKEYAWSLHESGRCDWVECPFCPDEPPAASYPLPPGTYSHPLRPVQGGRPSTETGSNHVSRSERAGTSGVAIANTIKALRSWGEDELAVMVTEVVCEHDPNLLVAAAAGWLS